MRVVVRNVSVFLPVLLMFAAGSADVKPLSEDERAGLRFLDFVTEPRSAADEKVLAAENASFFCVLLNVADKK